ncbi:uncharacterized protein [Triticum aestivum]|uniref:uncharacterized protein n=1 Tax=Triticum aestivum TaxID=4565 RepID=UPI001D025875|nr:uncharacterized protein LOC123142777 [Triticum aestivum]
MDGGRHGQGSSGMDASLGRRAKIQPSASNEAWGKKVAPAWEEVGREGQGDVGEQAVKEWGSEGQRSATIPSPILEHAASIEAEQVAQLILAVKLNMTCTCTCIHLLLNDHQKGLQPLPPSRRWSYSCSRRARAVSCGGSRRHQGGEGDLSRRVLTADMNEYRRQAVGARAGISEATDLCPAREDEPLDPVGNIILNTIWYSRAYPPAKNVEISAISTRGLLRIAVRSLYGLVSFLCTRCAATHLTPDEAIRRLQAVGADLRLADPNLLVDDDKNDDDMVVSATVEQAYTAAAAAARHPEPHDQVELLRPSNSVSRMASDRLKGDAVLSHEDAEHLPEYLMYSCMLSEHQQQPETKIKVLDRWAHIRVQHRINKFWDQHARLVGMAKSAMDSYSNELGVPSYKLHVICGANEYVDGPVCTRPGKGYYRCSHINFLAAQSAATPPTLFFAECANDGTDVRLCCPVRVLPPGTEQVRCMYCEYHGSRIVHPTRVSFRGRNIEFEKMLCGEGVYSKSFTNNGIIAHSREASGCVGAVVDDCIYDVYRRDDTPIKAEDFVRMSDANVVFD